MKRKIIFTICIIIIAILTVGFFIRNGQHKGKNGQNQNTFARESTTNSEEMKTVRGSSMLKVGTEKQKGFINDNVLHSDIGDIQLNNYIPDTYDGAEPYALFITLQAGKDFIFKE